MQCFVLLKYCYRKHHKALKKEHSFVAYLVCILWLVKQKNEHDFNSQNKINYN